MVRVERNRQLSRYILEEEAIKLSCGLTEGAVRRLRDSSMAFAANCRVFGDIFIHLGKIKRGSSLRKDDQ